MAFFSQTFITLDPFRRALVVVEPSPDLNFSQILESTNRYYSGSIVVIREQWVIQWEIENQLLIDIDNKWAVPKVYLGSWQILDSNQNPIATPGYSGFCNSITTNIQLDSYAVVTADPDQLTVSGAIGKIQSCNFTLIESAIEINGQPVTAFVPDGTEPLLQFFPQEAPPTVGDSLFYRKLYSLGLYANPGCRPVVADYLIYDINYIPNQSPAFEPFTCATQNTCQTEFDAYILLVNGGNPIDQGNPPQAFSNIGACNAIWYPGGGSCALYEYTCTSGETRVWYGPIQS